MAATEAYSGICDMKILGALRFFPGRAELP